MTKEELSKKASAEAECYKQSGFNLEAAKGFYDGYVFGFETAQDEEREKAREAFCLATCKGKLHRSTCTSLGTCDEYDEFCRIIRKQ